MKKDNCMQISDFEILEIGLNHLAEAAGAFFEIETNEGKAIAFMVDSCIRYAQAIKDGKDPRLSEEFIQE